MRITKPAHYTFFTTPVGASWYAEIEVSGRCFAAVGASIRECAEILKAKAAEAGIQ